MATSTTNSDGIAALNALVDTSTALIIKLRHALDEIANKKSNEEDHGTATETQKDFAALNPPDALAMARDSAVLIKAYATKISVFIINEPFTPSALSKVLRELMAGPVPALVSAFELCDPKRYTRFVQHDLECSSKAVMKELERLLGKIPRDGKAVAALGQKDGQSRDSITTTGVLWSLCDEIIELARLGVAGLIVQKVDSCREVLKDVAEELKGWGEEEGDAMEIQYTPNGIPEEEINGGLEDAHLSTQAMLDNIMNSPQYIPRNDPFQIRPRLESCLRRLRLITLLCQAVVKRRIRTMPKLPPDEPSNIPKRLDEFIDLLERFPEQFGEIASGFYELDEWYIDREADKCFLDAYTASELLAKSWDGQKDEFTDWALKFQAEIKRT